LLAGWLAAWLAGCLLVAGWLAGWLDDGWLAAGWPGHPGYQSHDVPALDKKSRLKITCTWGNLKRSNEKINYFEPHFGGSTGAHQKDQFKRLIYICSIFRDRENRNSENKTK
jgi:hypothetical protein